MELKDHTYVLAASERACAAVRCPEGNICLQGRCMKLLTGSERGCLEVDCGEDEACYLGTCYRAVPRYCETRGSECRPDEVCLSGACVAIETRLRLSPEECGAKGVVWKGRCLRTVEEALRCPFACREGEICLPGGCYAFDLGRDACDGVECAEGRPCVGGECWEPNERQDFKPCDNCPPGSRCVEMGRISYCVLSEEAAVPHEGGSR